MGGIILFDGVCNFVIALFNLSSNMIKLAIFNLHRPKRGWSIASHSISYTKEYR